MSFEVTGEAYDRFMGRYSRVLAVGFADWLEVSPGQRAIDVGCGPGALTGVLAERLGDAEVAAVDPSPSFVQACRERFPGVEVRQARAESLPFDGDAFDVAAACLVIHFMSDPVAGLAEMARVTKPGGMVGATVWDIEGRRAPMAPVWRAMAVVDPGRPPESGPADGRGEAEDLLRRAGLGDVESTELAVTVTHATFEEWWKPYLHGVGPIGEAVASLGPDAREHLVALLREDLGDGPFDLTAGAWAVRGRA